MSVSRLALLWCMSLLSTSLGCAEALGLDDYVPQTGQGGAPSGGAGGSIGGSGGAGGGGGAGGDTGFLDNWGARVALTIDTSRFTTALTEFHLPLIVDLDEDAVAMVSSDGADFRLTARDSVIPLETEVERWAAPRATLWVRVPRLDSADGDLELFLYFGNPAAAAKTMDWPGHAAVYHLSDRHQDPQHDSTSHMRDTLQATGGVVEVNAGKAGRALRFPSGARAPIPEANALEFGSASFTISAWLNPANPNGTAQCAVFNGGVVEPGYALGITTGDLAGFFATDGTLLIDGNMGSVAANSWTHLAAVVDRPADTIVLYQDGEVAGTADLTGFDTIENIAIEPSIGSTSCPYTGNVDEVRFVESAVSGDMIRAEFSTLDDPVMVNVGALEEAP